MSRPIPSVGDTVWLLNVGNAARYTEQKLHPETVVKVGRKYFTTAEAGRAEHMWHTFHLDSWWEKTEYSANWRVYASPGEYEMEKERTFLLEEFRRLFDRKPGLDLDQLRRIKAITVE